MLRIYILSEPQNHRCCYCGHQMVEISKKELPFIPKNAMTREHVEAKSNGGLSELDNLVAACQLCNELRGNMDAFAFYNLQQKWFRRGETLRDRWHNITRDEYREFKRVCLHTQERQLRGLARNHLLYRVRHTMFMAHHG